MKNQKWTTDKLWNVKFDNTFFNIKDLKFVTKSGEFGLVTGFTGGVITHNFKKKDDVGRVFEMLYKFQNLYLMALKKQSKESKDILSQQISILNKLTKGCK